MIFPLVSCACQFPILETPSEQQDIPLVQVPSENPPFEAFIDEEEQVFETLLHLRRSAKRKAPGNATRKSFVA